MAWFLKPRPRNGRSSDKGLFAVKGEAGCRATGVEQSQRVIDSTPEGWTRISYALGHMSLPQVTLAAPLQQPRPTNKITIHVCLALSNYTARFLGWKKCAGHSTDILVIFHSVKAVFTKNHRVFHCLREIKVSALKIREIYSDVSSSKKHCVQRLKY